MKKCIVNVCTHRYPTDDELKSFGQLLNILGNGHDIELTVPESLDVSVFHDLSRTRGIDLRIDRLPDDYFTYVGFNEKIMQNIEFWKLFEDYEFLLHYELDAWVFSDELLKWCEMDYDYIGAPWRNHGSVGNGGFSLMKVSSMTELVKRNLPNVKSHNFDWKWCHEYKGILKVPDMNTAAEFSIETDVGYFLDMIGDRLPFGCHAYRKYDYDLWKRKYPDFEK